MNLSSLSSFATTAFDSARSNLKAMADAARDPNIGAAASQGTAAQGPAQGPKPLTVAEAVRAAEAGPSAPAKNKRLGLALDSYA